LQGCASLKKNRTPALTNITDTEGLTLAERIKKSNLSADGFYIQKAQIEYFSGARKEIFLASVKYEYPFKYLISLKSRTGLEGARIYITRDSILVNDRINKIVYFGSTYDIRKKFGIDQSFISLLFGDFVDNENRKMNESECINGTLSIDRFIHGLILHYIIDCRNEKVKSAAVANNSEMKGIEFSYEKYKRLSGIILPGVINMKYLNDNIRVKLKILKLEYPWKGTVTFIPGKGYKEIELL
jgi:hypothetical protein